MPYLSINTNQVLEDSRRDELLRDASALVAEQLGKPERYVLVAWHHNPAMRFAGSDAPLAYLELKSIGLPADATGNLSAALCTFMGERLGVPADRVYVEFADAARHMWGWNGGTF